METRQKNLCAPTSEGIMVETHVCAIAVLGVLFVACWCCEAAYRNGVNDGFKFTKDPSCPGYAKAKRILQRNGDVPED